jgi:hypothetical protein
MLVFLTYYVSPYLLHHVSVPTTYSVASCTPCMLYPPYPLLSLWDRYTTSSYLLLVCSILYMLYYSVHPTLVLLSLHTMYRCIPLRRVNPLLLRNHVSALSYWCTPSRYYSTLRLRTYYYVGVLLCTPCYEYVYPPCPLLSTWLGTASRTLRYGCSPCTPSTEYTSYPTSYCTSCVHHVSVLRRVSDRWHWCSVECCTLLLLLHPLLNLHRAHHVLPHVGVAHVSDMLCTYIYTTPHGTVLHAAQV